MQKAKIKIIGTSHVSPESIREIGETIKNETPDCVAVELDAGRLHGLLKKEPISLSAISEIGFRNFLVAKIFSTIQRYLGRKTGVMPGEEMLTAVKSASEAKADLALIDQDICITLERMKTIPFTEKVKLFFSFFRKIDTEEKFDLRKVPVERIVEKVLDELREIFPTLYKVLVEERNRHMAKRLFDLSHRYKKIIAVVGIGHKKGILRDLKKFEMEKKELDKKIMLYKFHTKTY